jgi:hypothetical protein
MTFSTGQTSVSLFPVEAQPGLVADLEWAAIETYFAAEVIQPGRFVELNSGGSRWIQQVQDTGDSALPTLGISRLVTSRENPGSADLSTYVGGAAFNIGDPVPVVRRASMFVNWVGTTQVLNSVMNVYHSSTIATNRGSLTDAAIATTAGVEISVAPSWCVTAADVVRSTTNVALVRLNGYGKY